MLIMSIGKLVNLLEKRKVEQKTNKLLILSVELILLSTSQHKRKNLFIKKSQHKNEHISSLALCWHLTLADDHDEDHVRMLKENIDSFSVFSLRYFDFL